MQLKVYIIFFFICTFLSKIIFRVSFRRLEKRLINNSTRMRRCTGAKKKRKKRGRQLWNFGRHMSANLPPVKRARRSSATVKNLCSLLANLPNRRDGAHSLFAISR